MRLRVRRKSGAPALMLTSLLDMFTIILIFLIVSFEAEDFEFKLNPDLSLPESQARSSFKPALNLAVTKDAIILDNETIYPLKDGKATEADYGAGSIEPLVELLRPLALAGQEDEAAEEGALSEDALDPSLIVLQADKDLDYKTLYLVMRSASVAGFARYRLAIMKK